VHPFKKGLAGASIILSITAIGNEIDSIRRLIAPTERLAEQKPATLPSGNRSYQVDAGQYQIPDVTLFDSSGKRIELRDFLNQDSPVLLQFVFATCSTVCPILSASFASAQQEFDTLSDGRYRLISITIDPEQDTPEQLRTYGQRFKAGKHWHFLTGKTQDIQAILKAFDASYTGNNKMYHRSLTYMRARPGMPWLRIEGMLGKNALLDEYRKMMVLSE